MTIYVVKDINKLNLLPLVAHGGVNDFRDLSRIILDPLEELSPVVEVPQIPDKVYIKPDVDRGKMAYLAKINKNKRR